jgi:hypothetical protein
MEFTIVTVVETVGKVIFAYIGFLFFMKLSAKAVDELAKGNREFESDANLKNEAPSRRKMNWHIVHIRDDIGSAVGSLGVTNGLLGAILVVLIIF